MVEAINNEQKVYPKRSLIFGFVMLGYLLIMSLGTFIGALLVLFTDLLIH